MSKVIRSQKNWFTISSRILRGPGCAMECIALKTTSLVSNVGTYGRKILISGFKKTYIRLPSGVRD